MATETVQPWLRLLAGLATSAQSDEARIDAISALEQFKAAASGVQAELTAAFDASQRELQRQAHGGQGAAPEEAGRGVAAQIALARRVSPHKAARLVELARCLAQDLPHTLAALKSGALAEARAAIVASETATLSSEDRRKVDREIFAHQEATQGWGDRQLANELRQAGFRLDSAAVVERHRVAEGQRHVDLRPAPDGMAWLRALLPLKQAVAVMHSLQRDAARSRSAGDPRSRGQIMADGLCERVLGTSKPDEIPVSVQLIMPADLTENGSAFVYEHGTVPALIAADLLAGPVTVKRLFTDPPGRLVATESNSRFFPNGLAELIRARDRTCRTPWCDAPIRHIDHVIAHHEGGSTTLANGQGLCEACNHAKQAPGWRSHASPEDESTGAITIITPTGHRYRSTPPSLPPPGSPDRAPAA